jgi:hypothetical protein
MKKYCILQVLSLCLFSLPQVATASSMTDLLSTTVGLTALAPFTYNGPGDTAVSAVAVAYHNDASCTQEARTIVWRGPDHFYKPNTTYSYSSDALFAAWRVQIGTPANSIQSQFLGAGSSPPVLFTSPCAPVVCNDVGCATP